MKKNFLSFLTLVFFAFGVANAQNPVNDCRLQAEFTFKSDSCTVSYTDKSTADKGSTISKYYWSFGDGTVDSTQNPNHTYKRSGKFEVCLAVVATNAKGKKCTDKQCHEVYVKGCGSTIDSTRCRLDANFEFKTDSCTVTFADKSKAETGTTITGWKWNFGDGDSSNVQNPTHKYVRSGHYNVCVTITGKNVLGKTCFDRECRTVEVKGCGSTIDSTYCHLNAKFEAKKDSCTVAFTDRSTATSGSTITGYKWTFGDGDSSLLQNPSHTYKFSGHYFACLTITGKSLSGKVCTDRQCYPIEIKGCGVDTTRCRLSAKFEAKTDSCTVTFTDGSKTGTGTTITGYKWKFGDGDSSNVQNPTHKYAHSGKYQVCLTITGKGSTGKVCTDRECRQIFIKGCGIDSSACRLKADFYYDKDSLIIKFKDKTVATPGTTIKKWYWSFGDGTVDSVQNPTHVYKKDGIYKACLVVVAVNAKGKECKDMECGRVGVGRFRRDEAELADGASSASISSLKLYPNPANESVNINFNVETAGQVNITVTDIQGRVLAVVQDANMVVGAHNVQWNVNVNSGLYLVTIRTAAGVEQQQLLIQK
ncbi:MAG TPA: PKD domain-containing protein [Bacteroidia bacterium]|jgi:PKD repeat protein|nr:PKD domain-containing protein [Bacteroidia bacterium]